MDTLINFYRKYSKIDAAERYRRIAFFMSDVLAYVVGCDFLTPTYQVMNFRFILLLNSLIFFFVCTFYTVYVCAIESEWLKILECVSVAGMATQGMGKLLLAVYHRHRMGKQCLDLLDLHREHLHSPGRNFAMEKSSVLSDFMIRWSEIIDILSPFNQNNFFITSFRFERQFLTRSRFESKNLTRCRF